MEVEAEVVVVAVAAVTCSRCSSLILDSNPRRIARRRPWWALPAISTLSRSRPSSVAFCVGWSTQPLRMKSSGTKPSKARRGLRGISSEWKQLRAAAATSGSASAVATQKARKSAGRHLR